MWNGMGWRANVPQQNDISNPHPITPDDMLQDVHASSSVGCIG